MASDQTPSSKDWINSASTVPTMGRLGNNHFPNISATSLPLSVSDVPSLSDPHSSNLPGFSIPDFAVNCGITSSGHHNFIEEDDIVIAVMGLTGSGKSSFVNTAAGRTEIVVSNNLISQTRTVQPIRCLHPDGRRRIVLVDTPGFDDTHLSDVQILKIIAHWLKETYRNNVKLTGLLYLHRISDVRFEGVRLRNLAVFKDLCGNDSLKNVILVTTMWDAIQDESVGSEREEQLLSDFWKDMVHQGSRTCRFEGTHESAWEIINRLDLDEPRQRRIPLQIQNEMVDRGLPLHQTTAAKTLLRFLMQLAGEFKKVWAKLRNKARWTANPSGPLGELGLHPLRSRSPSIRSSSSETSWAAVPSRSITRVSSRDSTPPSSPTGSTSSGCSSNGYRETLLAAIRVLKFAHQAADIGHIPMLRRIIGTVLHIAQLIEEMGGTHHAISQLVQSSGWLLDEIRQYAASSKLSQDMNKTLKSFQKELNKLQVVVTRISSRRPNTRFLLHDADIEALTACATSIKGVYDKLGVKLAMENSQAIARFEDQLTALRKSEESRMCECGTLAVLHEESHENGWPFTSTCRSS